MYFSGLKRIIQGLEEKKFYDIALLFLESEGYKELSIVDGTGDGGRDVLCSRADLRIQLSVRKDWAQKINSEAAVTFNAGNKHLIYVTNRPINEQAAAEFRSVNYKKKGDVDLTIIDLNRITTSLARPGVIKRAYEKLGLVVGDKISASPKEIATSNLLLFSNEAKDLRENVIESNLKAQLFKSPAMTEQHLIDSVSQSLPGVDVRQNVETSFVRLRTKGDILLDDGKLKLSDSQLKEMEAAEVDYLQSIKGDLDELNSKYGLNGDDARKLIEMALEVAARDGTLEGDGLQEIQLAEFIASKGLVRKRAALYDDLSKLAVARVKQYGKTLDRIFSTNTFDIYRALGRNSEVVMVLDSSVAMPLMFGLSFGQAQSRYGIAAAALNQLCKEHHIKVVVPRCYLNEMAVHGIKALEFLETYDALADDAKTVLKSAGNAYISHYSHLIARGEVKTEYSLNNFLAHFGISKGARSGKIENSIESILDSFEIGILGNVAMDPDIREAVAAKKPKEPPIIIDHDAIVCTLLKTSVNVGFIFATWDRIISDVVEGLTRIYADTPARVTDFLSMAGGAQYECDHSYDLLASLLYCDEKKAAALASKIEQIHSVEQAHELKKFVDDARESKGPDVSVDAAMADFFLHQNPKLMGSASQ